MLNIHHLPKDVLPADLASSTTIVVDLLRASTTICYALAAGAECVIPFVEVEQTQQAATRSNARDQVVLGGERHGRLIPGFDLGNSPTEYQPSRVAGKRVLFTTTNGARALHHASQANRILVGSAVNRLAIAVAAVDAQRVDILCAGTDGVATREDILGAGAIADGLLELKPDLSLNAAASDALAQWRELLTAARAFNRTPAEQFALELRECAGGVNLLEIGHAHDLVTCAQLDALQIVPELNPTTGEIHPA